MAIAELRRKGLSLQKIRRVARFLRPEVSRRLSGMVRTESELFLLTDGKSVYVEDRPARIIGLLQQASRPMLLVSLRDQAKRLAELRRTPAGGRRAPRSEGQLPLF
jgi:hypothetical protein